MPSKIFGVDLTLKALFYLLKHVQGKNKQQKIHITPTFPVFDYSAHLNLCVDTVVLSGIKLVARIHECLSEFFHGTWTGTFDRFTCLS